MCCGVLIGKGKEKGNGKGMGQTCFDVKIRNEGNTMMDGSESCESSPRLQVPR